jgi:membrane-associated protease RseP (regulator of RpoE activity)
MRAALIVLLLGVATVAAGIGAEHVRADVGLPSAEVTLPAPLRHAVILRKSDGARLLLAAGDVLMHPTEPMHSVKIEKVGREVVVQPDSGRRQSLHAGSAIPGLSGYVLVETVTVARIEYQYRTVQQVSQAEPVLAALRGETAVLDVQVPVRVAVAPPPPPAPVPAPVPLQTQTRLDGTVLERVRMRQVAPEQYEVPRGDMHSVLASAATVLAELQPFVVPRFSLAAGVEYKITSEATDGQLSAQGFTVYDPKLARRAGIEIGDRILEVNGRPVDGLGSLYRIYNELRANPTLERVDVALERTGKLITKTLRVR